MLETIIIGENEILLDLIFPVSLSMRALEAFIGERIAEGHTEGDLHQNGREIGGWNVC